MYPLFISLQKIIFVQISVFQDISKMKQVNTAKYVVQIVKNVLILETIIAQFAMMAIIIKPTQI